MGRIVSTGSQTFEHIWFHMCGLSGNMTSWYLGENFRSQMRNMPTVRPRDDAILGIGAQRPGIIVVERTEEEIRLFGRS